MKSEISLALKQKVEEAFFSALCSTDALSEEAQKLLEARWGEVKMTEAMKKAIHRVLGEVIVRSVKVRYGRSLREALDAFCPTQHIGDDMIASMPVGDNGEREATVVFFFPRYPIDNSVLSVEHEYKTRGLRPALPHEIAAVNEADPGFAFQYRSCTTWKTGGGEQFFLAFSFKDRETYKIGESLVERHIEVQSLVPQARFFAGVHDPVFGR